MSIVGILISVLSIYNFIILARVLMTWLPNLDYSNPIVRFLVQVTEPILKPIREALPTTSGVDFSPMVVLIGIFILNRVLLNLG
jgi:YggT family protein